MKVAAVAERRQAVLVDKPTPRASGNMAVIRVDVAPMCNEYHAWASLDFRERNRPDSLGHEAVGEVVEVGSEALVRVGDRVIALCGYPCGRCAPCRDGAYGHCAAPVDPRRATGSTSGECGFAQYMLKADWMLVPLPEGMPLEHASMLLCGLGPGFGALRAMRAGVGTTVLVTGLGPVGLGAVVVARRMGARVIGLARNDYRVALARRLGATVLDPRHPQLAAQVQELTGGRGVDCTVETSGAATYQRLALDLTRRLGEVCFLAEGGDLTVNVDRDFVQKGLVVRGSLDINRNDASELLQIIRAAGEDIDTLITHRLPLADIGAAWALQERGACGKIVLYPWGDAPARAS